MNSTSPFSFPNPAELLSRSGSIPQYLYTAPTGGGGGHSESPGEFSSQSTVTSIKTEKWSNSNSDQVAFEGHRLPQTGSQEGSHSSIDRLALLASVASDSVFGLGSTSPSLSTYMAGSNVHSDALQTLHLMNPNFTGYGDSPNPGSNMVLFSPGQGAATSHGTSLGSSDQQHQQQHYFGYSLPATNTPSASLSHQSHMASMAIPELGHQDSPHDYYAKRSSSQGYNWGGGSEFSFLPSSQGTPTNPPLTSQMNLVKSAQAASSVGISQYGVGNAGQMSYHDQASLFTNSGMTVHGVNADNSQAPSGAGHILSLSLSPQQPSMMQQLHGFPMQQNESATNFFHGLSNMETENTLSKEDLFSNRGSGVNVGGSFTVPACDNMLGVGYQGPSHPAENRHATDMLASRFMVGSYGSKYLKPAQELLNEVVSIGRGIKVNALKRSKPQLWTAPTTDISDISFVQSMNATDVSCKAMVSWSGEKEGESVVATLPGNVEHAMDNVELSAAERQELHARRAKLVGMRDEVDRRYKQYYHQLQMSVTSFESATGLGAATAYTALALQTISKHFRCLRDAITGQIQVTCKRLGEEASGFARGDTSRLRFIDQQLRQQRALRQLGMMQQQAWRPQRGLPEHSVSILRAWLFEHFLHPYPKDADKIMLANQTGLNRNQVSNWFINARVRLWKPMVEEMYLEETREAEAEKGGDKSGVSEGDAGEDDGAPCNDTTKPSKQAKLSDESHGTYNLDGKGQSSYATDMLQNRALTGSPSDNAFLHEKEGLMQGAMKPRNLPQNTSLLPPGLNMVVDKSVVEGASEGQNMTRIEAGYKESYAAQSGFGPADHLNLSAYGSYQINNSLSRYGHDSFGASSNGANAGVSLTLGLQHCDGLSFSGSQQHYGQGTMHLYAGRREDDAVGAADYYNVNESSFEGLGIQNRKPFPAHMLCHDFVV